MKLDRRTFLAATGAACAFGFAGPVAARTYEPRNIPLWPEGSPGGGGPEGSIVENDKGAISNIVAPSMDIYMPNRPTGSAMLIAAGGGYKRIEVGKEAIPAARWLTNHGIIACVLKYRLPREDWASGPIAPLQDAHRAIRLISSGHVAPEIDPLRVGLLGFSAGGHLMGLSAVRSDFQSYTPSDDVDSLAIRLSVLALAYPVITLEPPYDHTSTRISLVGKNPTLKDSADWSVETYVRQNCPPTFLAQAENDSISDPQNTAIMEDACRKVGVPVERHLYSRGGHGFAMGRRNTPTTRWPHALKNWLSAHDMI